MAGRRPAGPRGTRRWPGHPRGPAGSESLRSRLPAHLGLRGGGSARRRHPASLPLRSPRPQGHRALGRTRPPGRGGRASRAGLCAPFRPTPGLRRVPVQRRVHVAGSEAGGHGRLGGRLRAGRGPPNLHRQAKAALLPTGEGALRLLGPQDRPCRRRGAAGLRAVCLEPRVPPEGPGRARPLRPLRAS